MIKNLSTLTTRTVLRNFRANISFLHMTEIRCLAVGKSNLQFVSGLKATRKVGPRKDERNMKIKIKNEKTKKWKNEKMKIKKSTYVQCWSKTTLPILWSTTLEHFHSFSFFMISSQESNLKILKISYIDQKYGGFKGTYTFLSLFFHLRLSCYSLAY